MSNNELATTTAAFTPRHLVENFLTASPKKFDDMVEAYARDAKGIDTDPAGSATVDLVPTKDGWHLITPEIAEAMLLRNAGNRRPTYGTVLFYARQMIDGDWRKTGQGILIDENGRLLDGQHRLWAVLQTGVAVWLYVVTGIESSGNMFAFIDASKARTAADSLRTAGFNGVSSLIFQTIKLAADVDAGCFVGGKATHLPKIPAHTAIELASSRYPGVQAACRLAASEFQEAIELTGGRNSVIAYVTMLISDAFGPEWAEEFFGGLGDEKFANELEESDGIFRLRALLVADRRAANPMKAHVVLGNMIRAFNAWSHALPLGKRWWLGAHEDLPALDTSPPVDRSAAAPEELAA